MSLEIDIENLRYRVLKSLNSLKLIEAQKFLACDLSYISKARRWPSHGSIKISTDQVILWARKLKLIK